MNKGIYYNLGASARKVTFPCGDLLAKREIADETPWDKPFEDIGSHLMPSLLGLIREEITRHQDLSGLIQRRLQLDFTQVNTPERVLEFANSSASNCLDILDLIVGRLWVLVTNQRNEYQMRLPLEEFHNFVSLLNQYFDEGNTNYVVRKVDDSWTITRKISNEITANYLEIESKGDSTSILIRKAWDKYTSHKHDYRESYSFSILALESVLCPIFLPNHTKPTLGFVIREMENHKGSFGIRGLTPEKVSNSDVLYSIVTTLWNTQPRHVEIEGKIPTEVSKEVAESALILTICLIQIIQSGNLEKNY